MYGLKLSWLHTIKAATKGNQIFYLETFICCGLATHLVDRTRPKCVGCLHASVRNPPLSNAFHICPNSTWAETGKTKLWDTITYGLGRPVFLFILYVHITACDIIWVSALVAQFHMSVSSFIFHNVHCLIGVMKFVFKRNARNG